MSDLCFSNNFTFINDQEITWNDVWINGIYLTNLDKAWLAKVFDNEVNLYLSKEPDFGENFIW